MKKKKKIKFELLNNWYLFQVSQLLSTISSYIIGVDSSECTCVCCAGEASVSLHVTQVPLLSVRKCGRRGLTSWNICAGYLDGGAGTCQVLHLCVIIINCKSHY